MTDSFSATERAALDRATVPMMRAGFAANIVSAANAESVIPVRRGVRGSWRRHGRLMIGAGALVLASATAAATGLLDRLPIAIPGITRTIEREAIKPKHVARAQQPRPVVGKPATVASAPSLDPAPLQPPVTSNEHWRERREERIAAGLPVRRPLVQRAFAAKLRAMPPEDRKAVIAEWRRIKALPPEERKAAFAKVKADYLAAHPRVAERVLKRMETRSAAAATGDGDEPAAAALPGAAPQRVEPLRPGPRRITPQGRALTPEERIEWRERRQAWRAQRRAQRTQRGGLPLR